MLYNVTHKTIYEYGDTVPECFNMVRLNPRPIFDQICIHHQLEITPKPDDLVVREDFFGNGIEQFSIHIPHESLSVTAINRVDVTCRNYPTLNSTPAWEEIAKLNLATDLLAAHLSKNSPRVSCSKSTEAYARVSFTSGRPIAEAAMDLTRRIFEDFDFDPDATTVSTPVEEVFQKRAGVCQDFAHFQIACFRSLNIPARYVSGYLRTIPPPGKARLIGADASHAWTSVYCGQAGWFDFDPTNNVIPETDHITIGWGRDYSDVCPIQGVFTGGGQTVMKVSVDVAPFTHNTVRVELRQAIEPWNVLGEETTGTGTSRYVDSSVEKMEVKVSGYVDERYVVTCNGRALPFHPTETKGEYVAGVRFRAWQPPSCLHPTIPVDGPLTFDLYDRWLGRSIDGCRYHVGHPGGLNPTTLPVNSYEAESRRAARFSQIGHNGVNLKPREASANRNFPMTLDLRKDRL